MSAGELITLQHDGRTRRVLIHVPAALGHVQRPVFVLLHGAGGTATWAFRESRLGQAAEESGFIAVLPEAVPVDSDKPPKFIENPPVWNDGSKRLPHVGGEPDDVGFIRTIVELLISSFAADRDRIYLAGFSNGASMTFRLAAELPGAFAAIGAVAGFCSVTTKVTPVRTLYIVGDSDPLVPLLGGDVVSPWTKKASAKPPVAATVQRWADAMNCAPPVETSNSGGVRTVRYDPWLELKIISGLGHHWPGGRGELKKSLAGPATCGIDANEMLWEFFNNANNK